MINTLKVAFRNIHRNQRRSLMTIAAISVGAIAITLFAEFTAFIILGLQTGMVQRVGHVHIYKKGFFAFGSGNPTAYGIKDYQKLVSEVSANPELESKIRVITPTVSLFGIAGNFRQDSSRTFLGVGFIPSDHNRMLQWDEYRLIPKERQRKPSGMNDAEETRGIVGIGLAKTIGLCETLGLKNCPSEAETANRRLGQGEAVSPTSKDLPDLTDLVKAELGQADSQGDASTNPRLDLLAATAGGAPNVVGLEVVSAEPQGVKEFDDAFVGMHLKLAQKLLYGRGEPQVTGLMLQLHRTEDIRKVKAALQKMPAFDGGNLEIKELEEIRPLYKQVVAMFYSIFFFIAVIMAVIVLFTIVNTMSMSVMERIYEIGTLRSLGVRRAGIRSQFITEGLLLGTIGASIGLAVSLMISTAVNNAGLTWMPPTQAEPAPLRLLTNNVGIYFLLVWVGLILIATLASWLPANRAARMEIVDALRHV